ncbi:MAG: hypothetical protein DMG07_10960, partial [Acidobacteria bacterium]
TEQWKLVYTKGDRDRTDGYETAHPRPGKLRRLYDVVADPGETTNLASRPEYRALVADLESKLYDRLREANPAASSLPAGLPREAAIDRLLRAPEEVSR